MNGIDRAHERLALLEQQLTEIQELAGVGTWEWEVGSNRLEWSDELHRIYGVKRGEVRLSFEAFLERLHPDSREATARTIRQVLEHGERFEMDERIVRPDGTVRTLRSRGKVVRDDSGRPTRLFGVCQDVTDQMDALASLEQLVTERVSRAEAELEKKRLAKLLHSAPAAIAMTAGPEHRIEIVNARFVALARTDDLVGMTIADVLEGPYRHAFIETFELAQQSGEARALLEIPVSMRSSEGVVQTGYFNFVIQPIHDADDALSGTLALGVEITEGVLARHRAEEQVQELARLANHLARVNRELDQFAYVASHDLKAPLRGIANLAQWLEEDLDADLSGESREHLALMQTRVHRMEGLIDGLLEYSRAGRVRSKSEEVNVGALVREVADLVGDEGLSFEAAVDLPTLRSERLPLHQVFQNLISNAAKHGARKIHVGWSDEERDFFVFSVADDGPGIAREYHERIWEIFQTLQPRDKVEGTGIGLALVKKIVESRGGRAWVESQVGEGATFHFSWPKEPAEES